MTGMGILTLGTLGTFATVWVHLKPRTFDINLLARDETLFWVPNQAYKRRLIPLKCDCLIYLLIEKVDSRPFQIGSYETQIQAQG